MSGQGRASHWAVAGIVPAEQHEHREKQLHTSPPVSGNSWQGQETHRQGDRRQFVSARREPRRGRQLVVMRRRTWCGLEAVLGFLAGHNLSVPIRRPPPKPHACIPGSALCVRAPTLPPPPPGGAGLRRPGRRGGRRAATHSNEQTLEDAKRNTRSRKTARGGDLLLRHHQCSSASVNARAVAGRAERRHEEPGGQRQHGRRQTRNARLPATSRTDWVAPGTTENTDLMSRNWLARWVPIGQSMATAALCD